jgi:hypothetical protein
MRCYKKNRASKEKADSEERRRLTEVRHHQEQLKVTEQRELQERSKNYSKSKPGSFTNHIEYLAEKKQKMTLDKTRTKRRNNN